MTTYFHFLRSELIRFAAGTLLGVLVALLLTFNALLLWVATGPRSLTRLTPYIESALAPDNHGYSVKIGETWLLWDGWQHPIDIRLKNVTIRTKEGQAFSSFPEMSVGLHLPSLAIGRFLPTSLTLGRPIISLFQNDDRSISFGFHPQTEPAEETTEAPLAAVLAPLLSQEVGGLRKLRQVTILDATVSVGNRRKGVFFEASGADIILRRTYEDMLHASISGKISYDEYQSMLHGEVNINQNTATVDGTVTATNLRPATLGSMFAGYSILSSLKLPISGSATFSATTDGTLQKLDFTVDGGKGSIDTLHLDSSLPISSMHVDGSLGNNGSEIHIAQATADLGGMIVGATGDISLRDNDIAIKGEAVAKNIPGSSVHMFWPIGASPQSRKWITENITDGTVTGARCSVNINFGDLAKPVMPKESIDAAIAIEGAKIRYLPEHPEVHNVNGIIHVDAVGLKADIASATYMKETTLKNGTLLIDDLNADNPYIKVNFGAETTARDMVKFLGLPRLKHAARLNLHENTAEGTATGKASVGFHFFAPKNVKGKSDDSDVDYDVTADLQNVTQPGFMNKFDISAADGTLRVKNGSIEFKGKGVVNGAIASNADVKYLFTPENGLDTFIDVTANAPVESLPRFGYPIPPSVKGKLGVKANIKDGETARFAQISLDLTNATVSLPQFNWEKPEKEAATLDFSVQNKEGAVAITSFHVKGRDMDAQGLADISKDLSSFQKITMSNVHYGKTALSHLLYQGIDGGSRLEATGSAADITGWLDRPESDGFSFEHFPALQLKADVGTLTVGKNRAFNAVRADVNCTTKLCESAVFDGKTTDGKPFSFRIMRNPKGQRQMSLHAESAGAFLRTLNIIDSITGGDLTITGNYDESKLKGRADITEHVIKHAPILAKILSLASLTGFFDTLQGNGIRFNRLKAPFTLDNDVITIEEAKSYGDAIGITAEGTITFPKRVLDLKGTVVPSYTLNNVFGKVPLLGPVLTGGEGKGIFAARYSVKGSEKDPQVTVNPLSMLTPGFLRNVFDVFDKPKKKDGKDTKADAPAFPTQ